MIKIINNPTCYWLFWYCHFHSTNASKF